MLERLVAAAGGLGIAAGLAAAVWACCAGAGAATGGAASSIPAAAAGGERAAGPAKPARPDKLLIVADERPAMEVLAEFLRKEAGYGVEIIDPKDLPAKLDGYFAVFQYIHGKMAEATERAIVDYARGGGRLVCLHHGIASARAANPAFLALTGIYIAPRSDPNYPWRVVANTTYTLVNLQPRHYITSHNVQWSRTVEYTSSDAPARPAKLPAIDLPNTEVFLNQHFTDGREKTVLFGFRCEDAATGKVYMQDRAGWYKPAGKGWVFYLQPGHTAADFRNRGYCRIIWNCLTWRPDEASRPVK